MVYDYMPEGARQKIAEYIEDKTVIDSTTGCAIYKGTPSVQVRYNGRQYAASVRRFVYHHAHPDEPLSSKTITETTCGNPDCISCKHLVIKTSMGDEKAIAQIIKKWVELKIKRHTLVQSAEILGVKVHTLQKYTSDFKKRPQYWKALWSEE